MNGQTKYDYPPQPSQATGDFPSMYLCVNNA